MKTRYLRTASLFLYLALIVLFPTTRGLAAPAVDPAKDVPLLETLRDFPASMRTENLQVSMLLRGIGRQAGLNIMVADDIQDTISLEIEKLTLYDVFQVIMDAKQLHYYQKNNVVFVKKKTVDGKGDQADLANERVCTKFGNAAAYIDQLKGILGPNGSISVTTRGNCLLIKDRAANFPRLKAMLDELDQPVPQVHIEARIVSISNTAKKNLGIVWGDTAITTGGKAVYARDNATDKKTSFGARIDLPAKESTTQLAFGFIRNNLDLNVELQALQSDNLLKILSSPSVLVLDGKEAEIKEGKEIPYETGGTATTPSSTSFREANLGLKVKPTVLENGYIILDVKVTNDSVDDNSTADSGLLINKQSISTNLFLEDQVTVVIGGIIQQNKGDSTSKVPGLGDVPILGHLFKNSNKSDTQSELMVFITPRIVTPPQTQATTTSPRAENTTGPLADAQQPVTSATDTSQAR